VLVKWTPAAEVAAGGAIPMLALAESAVAMSNHAYITCGIDVCLRPVGISVTGAYSGDGNGLETILDQLTHPSDGILDSVHTERNALGADLVALINATDPNYCGYAWINGDDAAYGFSVTVWDCMAGLTFTHEIGHNQGCCHAPGDGGGCSNGGYFSYSVGHRFVGADGVQYRSIMAYSPGVRVPRFSSPSVQYLGKPTGLVTADNARTVRSTAQALANFRCTTSCSLRPPVIESPLMPGPVAGAAVGFTASSVPPAAVGSQVQFRIAAVGDLDSVGEDLTLSVGGVSLGTVIVGGGSAYCQLRASSVLVPASVFNAAIGSGIGVPFSLQASSLVGSCAASEASVTVSYVPDSACAGDVNGDGLVDGADLGILLTTWGQGCESPLDADLNDNGTVDGADLGALLTAWGACPLQITSVHPNLGPVSGGTRITITGAGLSGATGVTIGGVAASSVQVINATKVTAVTPAGTVGAKAVAVTTRSGAASLAGAFTYVVVPSWATLVEYYPDPAVVWDPALRQAIIATGRPWRVKDTATQMEMLLIPPGSFQMGCSASNQYRCISWESPVHTVTLTNAFYLGRYEVTQAQWQARMGSNPSYFQSASTQVPAAQVPNRPVEQVSWNMIAGAGGFMAQTGMRLPTEAEWEYAYRAGTTTAFHGFTGYLNGTNDDTFVGNIAWYGSNSYAQTRTVGGKAGNGFGLHDMAGNVWEWVNDWYSSSYYASSPAQNPPGPAGGSNRVVRGGSWFYDTNYLRASDRNLYTPDGTLSLIGCRAARSP
jgi:formylglycine-generating enzyme required for sulfatase activity